MHARKIKYIFYGRAILSIALVLYLFSILEWERIKYILPKLSFEYVLQALILVLLSILVSSIRWSVVLAKLNFVQGVLDCWRFYIISMFYGMFLPGILGGDVVRLGLSIKKNGGDKKATLISIAIFERACGFMTILIICAVSSWLAPSFMVNDQAIASLVSDLSLAGVLCFIVFLGVVRSNWFRDKNFTNRVAHRFHLLLKQFQSVSFSSLLLILALSAFANILDIMASYFLARAIHIDLPFIQFLIIIPLVYVVTSLPISLGGLGVREGVLTFFLLKSGIVASDAILFALLIYLNRIVVALVGGLVQFMGNKGNEPV